MDEIKNDDRPFWETKSLKEMSDEEWELLCDGCGRCCYEKIIECHGKHEKIFFTRVACNLLDLKTGRCGNYSHRFELVPDCIKLSVKNLQNFDWLPATCVYRLLSEGKPLPEWHPLVTKNPGSVKSAGVQIKNGVHLKDVKNWDDYLI